MKEPRSTKSPLKTAEKERKQIMYVYVGVGKKVSHFGFFLLVFAVVYNCTCNCLCAFVSTSLSLLVFIGGKGTSWATWNPRGTRDWPSGTQGKVCYPILLEN